MKGLLRPLLLTSCFFLSAALLGYAWLSFQMARGVDAARQGAPEAAVAIFEALEAPFHTIPWLPRILRQDYERLVFAHARVLFRQEELDLVLEKFDNATRKSPAIRDRSEFAFWMGNLLIRRAAASEDGEEAVSYLKSALAEYQRGLVLDPEDWDLKYNYELTRQTFAQQEQAMKASREKVKSLLDTVRPRQKPKQDIAPEKLG